MPAAHPSIKIAKVPPGTYAFFSHNVMLNLFFFLLFYFIAASEGGANVFEVTYFKGTVISQST